MRWIAPLLILAGLLAGVLYVDSTPPRSDIVIVNDKDAFTLDPQRMSYLQDFRLAYALYEPLVRWNLDDYSIVPAAAESWSISADQLTWRFAIAPGAAWSNGEPVLADDFVYALRRLLMPDTAADYSGLLFVIDGAAGFFDWRQEQMRATAQASQKMSSDEARIGAVEAAWADALQQFDDTVGVRSLDDGSTLEIRLSQPTAYVLDLLCFVVCCPVYQPAVEGWPADHLDRSNPPPMRDRAFVRLDPATGRFEQDHQWARPGRHVSNGPYVLTQWRYKRDIRLDANQHFHRPGLLRNQSVTLLTIEDNNTRVLAFESGAAEWMPTVGTDYEADMLAQRSAYEQEHRAELDSLLASGIAFDDAIAQLPEPNKGQRRDIHLTPAFGTSFFSFNCRAQLPDGRENPFTIPAVRRAFSMAIDKQAVVEHATRLNEPAVNVLIPHGSIPAYDGPSGLAFDVDAAKRELASAGWLDRDGDGAVEDSTGDPFPVIRLVHTPSTNWVVLHVKSQWEQALGVQIELHSKDSKFFKEDLKQGNFMIAPGRWYGDYGDPTTFLDINRTSDGNNDRGFAHEPYDALLDQAANELDAARRMAILREAERMLVEEQLPLMPLRQLVQISMYRPSELRGVSRHPRQMQYFWRFERVAP